MNKLTELVNTHIRKIEAGAYDDAALIKLYRNIDRQPALLYEDRERLVGAIESHLRVSFPRAAKKLFGPKDTEAREQLNRIWLQSTAGLDLTGNKHKNGVKTGGDMMTGEKHVDVYISYKNSASQTVHLSIVQETPADPYIATLARYVVGGDDEEPAKVPAEQVWELEDKFSAAIRELV